MITAQEAFFAVRDRKEISLEVKEKGFLELVCKYIIDHVNHGWLCLCNIREKVNGATITDLNSMRVYLESLGYVVDSTYSIYWMYNPIIESRDNDNS